MSATDAANAAVERLRTLRVQARRRREQAKEAVRQLRERNRQESQQRMAQAMAAKRRVQPWPSSRSAPRMSLYEDEVEAAQPPMAPGNQPPVPPVPPVRPAPPTAPRRPVDSDEDDWSQETWLH